MAQIYFISKNRPKTNVQFQQFHSFSRSRIENVCTNDCWASRMCHNQNESNRIESNKAREQCAMSSLHWTTKQNQKKSNEIKQSVFCGKIYTIILHFQSYDSSISSGKMHWNSNIFHPIYWISKLKSLAMCDFTWLVKCEESVD